MCRPTVLALAALQMACGATSAADSQGTAPTEAQLHSVYCIPIVQARIQNEQDIVALLAGPTGARVENKDYVLGATRTELERLKSVLSRLQAHVTAILDNPDLTPVGEAIQRADSDLARFSKQTDQCTASCSPVGETRAAAQLHQCVKSCGDQNLLSRILACYTPTWLAHER